MFKSFSTAIEQYTQRVTAPEKPRLAHEERPTPNHLHHAPPPRTAYRRRRVYGFTLDQLYRKAVLLYVIRRDISTPLTARVNIPIKPSINLSTVKRYSV